MDSGYFLEDSVSHSIPKGTTTKGKELAVRDSQEDLVKRLEKYKKTSKFVLLSAIAFRVNYEPLKKAGFNILNDFMLPFPGSGQQTKFKTGISRIELN